MACLWLFFVFLGPLLILAFITFGYFSDKAEQKRHTEYINSPVVDDIYLMKIKTTNEGNTYYCFTKIICILPDSIDFHLGAYDYSYKVSKMDTADYFLTDGYYTFGKNEVKEMWENKSLKFIKHGTNSD